MMYLLNLCRVNVFQPYSGELINDFLRQPRTFVLNVVFVCRTVHLLNMIGLPRKYRV